VKLWRVGLAFACSLIVALTFAACGGDDDDDDGGTSAATSTAPAPEGPPIKLGSLVSASGPQKAVLGGSETVLKAWEQHVNESGGVNGHPVELTVIDDGADPAKALQGAKELVEQDGVVAIVGNTTLADAAVAPYFDEQGIPVIGGTSPTATFLTDPNWFASAGNLLALTYGTLDVAKKAGKTNLGVMYCAESPVCAQLVPLAQGIGQMVGIDITPLKISATAPNYTAPCLQMKDSGVDALYIADNGDVIQRVLASCAQQNYDPLPVGQATTATKGYLEDPNLDGSASAGTSANPYDDSLPVVAEEREALDSYQDGFTDSDEFTYDSAVFPWTGGLLFEAAAKAGNLGPDSKPEDVKNAMYKLKNETLEGYSGPLVFTPGKPTTTACWFTESIEGGTLASENDNKPTCLTPDQLAALAAALPSG
jgi:branched-chain amino acid transport system substrate-binding protein